ncbi:MAG TPA: SurA N-terminal domain-containing protein [Candidatus Paceibacterota bacterium]|nr:SurA N-terminal domain-containing protein [Candidatus Paceibacterota bacterium]
MDNAQEGGVPENTTNETPSVPVTGTEAAATTADEASIPAAPVTEPARRRFFEGKGAMVGAIVAALILIAGAGYYVYSQYYAKGGIVAVVNGRNIYRSELDESIAMVGENAQAYGIDETSSTANKDKQDRAMEVLVDNALLITAAENAGFDADDETVQKSYDDLVAQIGGEDALKSQMAAVGLTESRLRDNIRERVLVGKYIESVNPSDTISVSDKEVDDFIAQLKANNVELPDDMTTLRPQIEAEIKAQKQQQLVDALITKLKGEAQIDMRI